MSVNNVLETQQSIREHLLALNLSACKQWRPSLFKKIKDVELTGNYELLDYDSDPYVANLYDRKNHKLYYELDDPVGSIAQHVEGCINSLQGIMVCLGFGLGYAPLMLVKQENFVSRSIIILEPDPEILLHAFMSLDCRPIIESKDVVLLVDFSVDKIAPAIMDHILHENRLINARNVQLVDLPASVTTHGDYYDAALKKISVSIKEAVKLAGNCPDDALQGLDATLSNLRAHAALPGVNSLVNKFQGKPGVVVASGPSLDKNMHLLAQVGDDAVIVAADASLRMMLAKNLKPHIVTSLERVEETAKLFEGLDPEDYKDVFLLGSPICHPKTFELYKGPQISHDREHGFFKLLNQQKGLLPPGPSAGNLAFRLLQFLGCDPIILIGQDLSVDEDGKTHAANNKYGDEVEGYLIDPIELEGNYTETVRSNPYLAMFHQTYEYDVALASAKVVNATEGGAKIAGTEITTFEDAINRYIKTETSNSEDELPIAAQIANQLSLPTLEEATKQLEAYAECMSGAVKYLDSVGEIIATAETAANEFAELDPRERDDQQARREELQLKMNGISELTKSKQFQETALDIVSPVFIHTMMDYVEAMANCGNPDEQDKELIRNVNNLANNFRVLIRYVRELYNGHLEILRDELSSGSRSEILRGSSQ